MGVFILGLVLGVVAGYFLGSRWPWGVIGPTVKADVKVVETDVSKLLNKSNTSVSNTTITK